MSDVSGITCIGKHPEEVLQWHEYRLEFHMTFKLMEADQRLKSGMSLRSCLTSNEKIEILRLETASYQAEEKFYKIQRECLPLQLSPLHPAARPLYVPRERSGLQLTKP